MNDSASVAPTRARSSSTDYLMFPPLAGTRAVARRKDPRGMPAREVASQDLVTVEPETKLDDALKLMARHQVRRLPVVEDGDRLVGVVAQADVALEAKEKTTGELVEEISRPPEGPRL